MLCRCNCERRPAIWSSSVALVSRSLMAKITPCFDGLLPLGGKRKPWNVVWRRGLVFYDEHKHIPGIVLGGAISLFPHRKQAIVEQGTWNMTYRYDLLLFDIPIEGLKWYLWQQSQMKWPKQSEYHKLLIQSLNIWRSEVCLCPDFLPVTKASKVELPQVC